MLEAATLLLALAAPGGIGGAVKDHLAPYRMVRRIKVETSV
jgi:hypothetical protein